MGPENNYSNLDEKELVGLLRTGDTDAFTEIYNRFHKPIYRYLLAIVKTEQNAEDLTHEVFMKIWEIRNSIEIKTSFTNYLFRICHNKAIDSIRKTAKDRALTNELLKNYVQSSQPATTAEFLKYDALVEKALDSLPPQRRKVYDLCRRQGKSYAEVAAELGISTNTVKEHVSQALASLRSFLENHNQLAIALILIEKIF